MSAYIRSRITRAQNQLRRILNEVREREEELFAALNEQEATALCEGEVLYSSFVRKINNQLEKISKCESDWTTMIGAMEERERNQEESKMIDYTGSLIELLETAEQTVDTLQDKLSGITAKGSMITWRTYWQAFEAMVDSRHDLPTIQKLSYLLSTLEEKAASAVAGFDVIQDNYEPIKRTLKERFGNEQKIKERHIRKLLSLRTEGDSVEAARKMSDQMEAILLQLKSCGMDTESVMIRMAIERAIPHWMRHHIFNAEMLSKTWPYPSQKNNREGRQKFEEEERQATERCNFCNKSNHRSELCRTIPTRTQRLEKLKEIKACFKCLQIGHRSRKCRVMTQKCPCGCQSHPAICRSKIETNQSEPKGVVGRKGERIEGIAVPIQLNAQSQPKETALMTIEVILVNMATGNKVKALAFFDSGAEMSFITEMLATALDLKRSKEKKMNVNTFHGENIDILYKNCTIGVSQMDGTILPLQVRCVPTIVDQMKEIRKPSLIIGIDYYWSIIEKVSGTIEGYTIINSTVGQMLSGGAIRKEEKAVSCPIPMTSAFENLDETFENTFKLEAIGIKDSPYATEDELAWDLFKETITFNEDEKRYYVSLPWKDPEPDLPTNEGLARRQLIACKRNADRNPNLTKEFNRIINEWITQGVIEEVEEQEDNHLCHYLPYHIVEIPQKTTTKKRLVHNAGPLMLPSLVGMLLRFREYKIAISGDIEKAFLQLGLNEKDRDVLRFMFPRDWKKPVEKGNIIIYRFKRVNFGVISSPFLLAGTLKVHLEKTNTTLDKEILRNTYVDNVLLEADSYEEALQKEKFVMASMNLRELISSDPNVNAQWEVKPAEPINFLGIKWEVKRDSIWMKIPRFNLNEPTKRNILRQTAAIFDPLGFLCPSILPYRILIQELWKTNKEWNEPLTKEERMRLEMMAHEETFIEVPRRAVTDNKVGHELHVFCDASKHAYAACAYIRKHGKTQPSLKFAKMRLGPIRPISIPKMELLAVDIGIQMMKFLINNLSTTITRRVVWSDSQCVLAWIHNQRDDLPRFVENRLKRIRTENCEFNYINTNDNPADIATRGMIPSELKKCKLWWNGPTWLANHENKWPKKITSYIAFPTEIQERIVTMPIQEKKLEKATPSPVQFSKFSSWPKLISTVKFMILFIRKTCRRSKWANENMQSETRLQELAELEITRWIQNGHPPPPKDKSDLQLYRDKDGLWRCGGRLQNSSLPEDGRHPVYIPRNSEGTDLLILKYHMEYQHSRPTFTLAQIRQKYWIPRARSVVKRTLHNKCMECRRRMAKPFALPEMPPLPAIRVNPAIPFDKTGVDYCGPFTITREGEERCYKIWIALFTCLVTRAIHLEI
uniref:CCHC-type domain-containing protein n=1 Tax=Heterorhabditis bacteriophora TaxID=37862 RepID=A0A1I7WTY4_HETBA